jgi:hypothetical protein
VAQPIDFATLGGPVYVGRANGTQARKRLKIDVLDAEADPIRVLIPEQTYSVNSSFFLGMFGPSLTRLDSPLAFFTHYDFRGPDHVLGTLRLVVDRALASRGKLALTG